MLTGVGFEFMDYLRELNFASIFLRFSLAVICGGIIGMERGKKRHAAGLRTHLIVCIGSASVMMVSQFIHLTMSSTADPGRLGAQVISGIGFLGVGTIVVTGRNQVKGLTTAAGLWASACMGLAIGIAFYEVAIIMCVFLYLVLEFVNLLDERYLKTAVTTQLYLEYELDFKFSEIIRTIKKAGWNTSTVEYMGKGSLTSTAMLVTINKGEKNAKKREVVLERIREVNGVLFVEEM